MKTNKTGNDAMEPPDMLSPCVKVCVIHPVERICIGCLRTLEEIGLWSTLQRSTRQKIMAELPGRASRLAQRRGGRAARVDGQAER